MVYFNQSAINAPETKQTKVRRAYCAIRRKEIARARVQVTKWSDWPRELFSNDHAKDALRQARLQVENDTAPKYGPPQIWSGLGGSDGATFAAYGESACRWIENPETKGLRFVGLAHAIGVVDHKGWFLDRESQLETVSGVVYQLPACDGKARYLAGYADPYNCDSDGRGPALLSLEVIEGERIDSSYDTDSHIRDAARRGDDIAESMADAECDYQDAWRAGQKARELTREAVEAGKLWIAEIRAFRDLWKARRELKRETVCKQIASVRAACESYTESRDNARVYRNETKPEKVLPHFQPAYAREIKALQGAFAEGYKNAF